MHTDFEDKNVKIMDFSREAVWLHNEHEAGRISGKAFRELQDL